jgi:hypothetical protein
MGNDYYLCDPTEIVIRHSQNTCELDIISAISDPQPKYMNCEFDSIKLKAEDQYALIVRENLSISSMEEDELHYICQNPADSRVKTVKAGFSIHKTVKGCVYETSKLTIYNSSICSTSFLRYLILCLGGGKLRLAWASLGRGIQKVRKK